MKSGDRALVLSGTVLQGDFVKLLQPAMGGWWKCSYRVANGESRVVTLHENQLHVED